MTARFTEDVVQKLRCSVNYAGVKYNGVKMKKHILLARSNLLRAGVLVYRYNCLYYWPDKLQGKIVLFDIKTHLSIVFLQCIFNTLQAQSAHFSMGTL